MQIKFKKMHPDAQIPVRSSEGAAGFDVHAVSVNYNGIDVYNTRITNGTEQVVGVETIAYTTTIDTGIAVEIPTGYVGYLFPRGSITKQSSVLSNSVGVIDSDFRGSIKVILQSSSNRFREEYDRYKPGDRVAQLIIMPIPFIEFVEVDELSETERGVGMLGSTGR